MNPTADLTGRICAKACKLALLEFQRIGYQIKADEEVLRVIRTAVFMYETKHGKLDVPDCEIGEVIA